MHLKDTRRDSARSPGRGHRRLAHPAQCAQATDLARSQCECRGHVFVFGGRIDSKITLVMAIAALVGGAIASRVPAKLLRWHRDCGRPRNVGRLLRAAI